MHLYKQYDSFLYKLEYQKKLRELMSKRLSNPFFLTIRMKQHPKGKAKLNTENAYRNNRQFLSRFHNSIIGNNWKRRYPEGLTRFVFLESSASVGIHTHMLIDVPDIDLKKHESKVYQAYEKTDYFGQPYKNFNDGQLIQIDSVFNEEGLIKYITKLQTKSNIDTAFDVENSYW